MHSRPAYFLQVVGICLTIKGPTYVHAHAHTFEAQKHNYKSDLLCLHLHNILTLQKLEIYTHMPYAIAYPFESERTCSAPAIPFSDQYSCIMRPTQSVLRDSSDEQRYPLLSGTQRTPKQSCLLTKFGFALIISKHHEQQYVLRRWQRENILRRGLISRHGLGSQQPRERGQSPIQS